MTTREIVKNTMIMTAFALVFGLLLGVVHAVTLEPIRVQNEKTLNAAYSAVLSGAAAYEDMGVTPEEAAAVIAEGDYNAEISSVLEGKDGNGAVVGYIINVVSHGAYGGDIGFSMGLDPSGSVQGISITDIAETPGLGMRAKDDPAWLPQFYGQEGGTVFTLGDNIQTITSATFTSRCITRGVNAGLAYFQSAIGG